MLRQSGRKLSPAAVTACLRALGLSGAVVGRRTTVMVGEGANGLSCWVSFSSSGGVRGRRAVLNPTTDRV